MTQQKSNLKLKIALLGILIGLLPLSQSHARLYKWTDENGSTHYGDTPPPVNTEYGHQVLNKGGMRVRVIEREQTEEERLAASRITQEMAAKIHEEENLARIDRLLTVSFPNFKSLAAAREDRLATLDDSIAYLQSRHDAVMEKHATNNARIQHFRRKKLSVPDKLNDEAATIASSVKQLEAQIADIEKDREATVMEFDQYEDRLRELLAR